MSSINPVNQSEDECAEGGKNLSKYTVIDETNT